MMNITTSHLPTFCSALEDAIAQDKMWVAYDLTIQQLSAYDLEFFNTGQKAEYYQWDAYQNEKDVVILPTDALLQYVQETAKEMLKEGKQFSQIPIDDEAVLTYDYEIKFNQTIAELESLMESYDWKKTHYDPLEANTEAESFDDKMQFNRLEYLMEQLSKVASEGDKEKEAVAVLTERYWKGESMEVFSKLVNQGKFHTREFNSVGDHSLRADSDANPLHNKDGNAFTDALFDHWDRLQTIQKINTMVEKNKEYLENQARFAGFSEKAIAEIGPNMEKGLQEFTVNDVQKIKNDDMIAVLLFAKSQKEGTDMYFFNRWDATMTNENLTNSQTFFINNKGQNLTVAEACNLLNGRAVFKEVTNADGEKYKAWIQLDFSDRDANGNAKMKYYNQNYGFNLRDSIKALNLKKFTDPEKLEQFYAALQRGDQAQAVLLKGGKEIDVLIAADAKFKTVKMWDKDGNKLYVPSVRQEKQYGQAPADAKKTQDGTGLSAGDQLAKKNDKDVGQTNGQAGDKKKEDLMQKNENKPDLLEKKKRRQGRGQGIS